MHFLTPWTALLAAAVTLPPLVALYFLKLRRRRQKIASTLLWRRSFEDLQVNVPFQRLRFSVLFLLQLLALLLLVLAAGGPVLEGEGPSASRVILLVDRSASMNARDVKRADGRTVSRLAAARTAAGRILRRLSRGGASTPVMIIAFGAAPQLVTGFEARREVLEAAIASIEPTDEEADLDAALQLAGTFARRGEPEAGERPDVVLISDGGVAPPAAPGGFRLRAGRFRFVRVGPHGNEPAANLGLVALSARRDYDDPAQVLVFARVLNAGPAPVETMVTLLVNDRAGPIHRLTIDPPGGAGGGRGPGGEAGEATVSFAIDLPGGAVLSARLSARDALAADDTAAVVMPPPARPRIALVRDPDRADPYLEALLRQSEPRALRLMSAEAYAAALREGGLARRLDLVVFDGVAPGALPPLPSLWFGAAPPEMRGAGAAPEGGRRILSWRRQHPLMRHVSLDTIVYTRAVPLRITGDATVLAQGPEGAVIALGSASGVPHVVVAFALAGSNWPTHVSVAVFLQNALDYLTLARSGQSSIALRPGEALTVRHRPGSGDVVITAPGGQRIEVPVETPGALVTLPVLRRAGLYAVAAAEPPHERLAVSVLSAVESDTRPAPALLVNAEPVPAGAAAEVAPRAVWPWFAAAAAVVLVVEWLAWCRLSRA